MAAQTASSKKITADEFLESLTGYDELAINKHFGAEVFVLAGTRQTAFLRSLVFIQELRDGKKADAAYKASMDMTLAEINSHFSEVEDVESGEGETPSE